MTDLLNEVIDFINDYENEGYVNLDNCHIPLIAQAAQCTGYVHFDVFNLLTKHIEDDFETHGFNVETQPDKTVAFWTHEHMLVTRFHYGDLNDTVAGVLIPFGDEPAPTVEEAAETLINFCRNITTHYPNIIMDALTAFSGCKTEAPNQ